MEITGLRSLENQMKRDLSIMKLRQRTVELSGTLYGQLLSAFGWVFTIYCLIRVASVRGFFPCPVGRTDA